MYDIGFAGQVVALLASVLLPRGQAPVKIPKSPVSLQRILADASSTQGKETTKGQILDPQQLLVKGDSVSAETASGDKKGTSTPKEKTPQDAQRLGLSGGGEVGVSSQQIAKKDTLKGEVSRGSKNEPSSTQPQARGESFASASEGASPHRAPTSPDLIVVDQRSSANHHGASPPHAITPDTSQGVSAAGRAPTSFSEPSGYTPSTGGRVRSGGGKGGGSGITSGPSFDSAPAEPLVVHPTPSSTAPAAPVKSSIPPVLPLPAAPKFKEPHPDGSFTEQLKDPGLKDKLRKTPPKVLELPPAPEFKEPHPDGSFTEQIKKRAKPRKTASKEMSTQTGPESDVMAPSKVPDAPPPPGSGPPPPPDMPPPPSIGGPSKSSKKPGIAGLLGSIQKGKKQAPQSTARRTEAGLNHAAPLLALLSPASKNQVLSNKRYEQLYAEMTKLTPVQVKKLSRELEGKEKFLRLSHIQKVVLSGKSSTPKKSSKSAKKKVDVGDQISQKSKTVAEAERGAISLEKQLKSAERLAERLRHDTTPKATRQEQERHDKATVSAIANVGKLRKEVADEKQKLQRLHDQLRMLKATKVMQEENLRRNNEKLAALKEGKRVYDELPRDIKRQLTSSVGEKLHTALSALTEAQAQQLVAKVKGLNGNVKKIEELFETEFPQLKAASETPKPTRTKVSSADRIQSLEENLSQAQQKLALEPENALLQSQVGDRRRALNRLKLQETMGDFV